MYFVTFDYIDCLLICPSFRFWLSCYLLIQLSNLNFQVADEAKYIKTLKTDRTRQLYELSTRMDENSSAESNNRKAFEDEIQSCLNFILASDANRRAAFQLAYEEEQQNVAVCLLCTLCLCY